MLRKGNEANKQETSHQKQNFEKNHDACNSHLTLIANISTKKMT
jgi:hypothetical protein